MVVAISRVHKREKRVSSCLKAVFEVQRSPDILRHLCSSYNKIFSSFCTKHNIIVQVYFVHKKRAFAGRYIYYSSLSYPCILDNIYDNMSSCACRSEGY